MILEPYLIATHKPIHNIEYNVKDLPTVRVEGIISNPIVVTASFGVNGLNTYKEK